MKACSVAWCRPSARIASSIVWPLAASAASSSSAATPAFGSCSRESLQQADDERRVELVRPGAQALPDPRATRRAGRRRADARGSSASTIRPRPQVVDQRQLEHARPRPQLAHRQRRDGLEGRDEPVQALRIETAGAVADELEGHRVDAWKAGELVGRDPRQALVERRRQIVADVACRRRDDVEVVEQPLGRRRRLLAAARVFSEARRRPAAARACARRAAAGGRRRSTRPRW